MTASRSARSALRGMCVALLGAAAPAVLAEKPGDVSSGVAESAQALRPAAVIPERTNIIDDWHWGDFEPMPLCVPGGASIPNGPGGTAPFFERYDADTGDIIPFEAGDPLYFPDSSAPREGEQWFTEEGRGEIDGPEFPEIGAERNFTAPLALVADPSPWPYRPNCKLFMRFRNAAGQVANLVCSGTLIDSRHIVTAGHCVYAHSLAIGPPAMPGGPPTNVVFNAWAERIRVVPARNNANEPYCYSDMINITSFTCWTNAANAGGANYDCDVAIVQLDRPIGALTGWFGFGTRPNCSGYTGGSQTFFNRGYPAAPPYNPGLFMYDQSGNFDSCETNFLGNWTGNEVTINRQSWGGQSGSSAYKFINNSRAILAILSNGTDPPGATTSFAAVDSHTFNLWRNTVNGNTPAAADRIPLSTRATMNQVAGRRVAGVDFLIHNYSSASSAGVCNFDLYLSGDQIIRNDDTLLGSGRFTANIGPKASLRLSYSNNPPIIPANTPPGTYYLGFILTTGDANNGNNIVHVCDVATIQVTAIGACCQPNGTCVADRTLAQCNALGGTYQGNGTICNPNPCPIIRGACCGSSGVCFLATATECTQNGGIYFGDFVSCGTIAQCPNAGACCAEDGSCRIASALSCAGPGEQYRGNGTNCNPNPCAPATQPVMGACCDADNACELRTEGDCAAIGGTFQGAGTTCASAPCPLPIGACCGIGPCQVLSDFDCFISGGEYQGDGAVCPDACEPPPPSGACCDNAAGTCVTQTAAQCAAGSGVYQGDGTSCDPFPCPAVIGACCKPDGACVQVTAAGCAGLDGIYQGDGSPCGPNPCPQPATGACCTLNGGCVVLSAFSCALDSGQYLGDGTACDPNPCPQPGIGACCFADGSCAVVSRLGCLATNSLYLGDDTGCGDGACSFNTGACCDAAGACSIRTRVVCEGTGGRYFGDGSACTGPTCGGGLGDMNCDGRVSVLDIGPFVLALTDPAGYAPAFPDCFILNGDFSRDAAVTPSDIAAFVNAVVGGGVDGGGR